MSTTSDRTASLSRREILAQWQPDNEQFWNQYGKKLQNKI